MTYIFLYLIAINLEALDWRIPYVGFIIAGAIIVHVKIKETLNPILNFIMFLFGIYISATGDYVGIYKPLAFLWQSLGLNLKVIGVMLINILVTNNDKLKQLFDTKIGKWLSKYSLAIYVIHWSVVISVSCWVTYIMHVVYGINYMLSGTVGIIIGLFITVLIAVMFTEDVYVSYEKNVLNRVKKIITKLSGESNEKRGAICNFISKVP